MHDSKKNVVPQAKSYSSVYDLTEASDIRKSCGNCKGSIKTVGDLSIFQTLIESGIVRKQAYINNSEMLNVTPYVTSERYHSLNKKSSDKSVIRSTSTFFYDLDSLAKRHSYHCVTEVSESKNKNKSKNSGIIKNGFGVKSEAIVQECATEMKPKLLTTKTNKEIKKKGKKDFPNETLLSSEIFLRDNEATSYKADDNHVKERHQKFWSFTKYKTEYTNPVDEKKEQKKKDRGKRTEDPCPCQLFSYACPCTNEKSLTELAKNSKSLTVADQITSTTQVFVEETKYKKHNKNKKTKNVITYVDKRTSTVDVLEITSNKIPSSDPCTRNVNNNILRKRSDDVAADTIKCPRKPRKVLCPNCKEMVNVSSTTEEEESLKSKNSPIHRENLSSTATYTYHDIKGNKNKLVESRDICSHDPQCELVPVCQILPTDNIYVNPNITKKQSPVKPNSRVIRITKGCRHHPPCTVVPSCQRMNVLNNNCEYIPPCLHRPRCVNLPLCAPLSKSIYYEENSCKPEQDSSTTEHLGTECINLHQNRYITNNQYDLTENQINLVQNTCEYLSECTPRFVINPTLGCISPIPSPCQPMSYKNSKSEKSCQFELDWKPNLINQEKKINDDVMFIRDVGCQFRNKNNSPNNSVVRSKTSSGSFNYFNANVDKYCGNFHTLRYEDKFTLPISGEELSISTGTLSSTEIDSQCPTHGRHQTRECHTSRPTGFIPKSNLSPFVGYTKMDSPANFYLSANDNFKKKLEHKSPSSNASTKMSKTRQNSFCLKSRSSFFKGKHKNMFAKRRKRKSSTSFLSKQQL